jgi:CrcB protein
MYQFLIVGIGGFLGTCMRFGLTKLLGRYPSFPFGTLLSNIVAGLLIGLVIGADRHTSDITPALKLFMTTGLIGGLSTFSTFSLETIVLVENGSYLKAGANTLLNISLCFSAVVVGLAIMKFGKRFA